MYANKQNCQVEGNASSSLCCENKKKSVDGASEKRCIVVNQHCSEINRNIQNIIYPIALRLSTLLARNKGDPSHECHQYQLLVRTRQRCCM